MVAAVEIVEVEAAEVYQEEVAEVDLEVSKRESIILRHYARPTRRSSFRIDC